MENQSIESLPAEPGSYALHLALRAPVCLEVGRLGIFAFPAGDYVYLGSARGPGGLRARLCHHARAAEHPHWHLDWLRRHAVLLGGWAAPGSLNLECVWSQALLRLPGASIPVPGFGAADCRNRCPAHLVAFLSFGDLARVETELSSSGVIRYRLKSRFERDGRGWSE